MKVGVKVSHKKHGMGQILEDINGDCRDGESLVRFYDGLPILKQSAIAGYSGQHLSEETMYEDRDIFKNSELTKV